MSRCGAAAVMRAAFEVPLPREQIFASEDVRCGAMPPAAFD